MRISILLLFFIQFCSFAYAMQISEVMYNPAGSDSGHEWIEIYNNETIPSDIEKWTLYENEANHNLLLNQAHTSSILVNMQ